MADRSRWRRTQGRPSLPSGGTLVLETVFETEDGEVAVIDFMPHRSQVPELLPRQGSSACCCILTLMRQRGKRTGSLARASGWYMTFFAAGVIIRVVEGRRGRVPMHLELVMRFDYGSIIPWPGRPGQHTAGGQAHLRACTHAPGSSLRGLIFLRPKPGN